MMKQIREMRWTILLAITVAFAAVQIAVPLLLEARQARIDAQPVVVMQGKIVARDVNSVTLHLWGEKLRACTYIGINAYTRHDGVMKDAFTKRVDVPHTAATKPLGRFDVGNWLVWPIDGAGRVLLYVQHDCNGRVVVTKIAEVDL